MKVRVHFNDSKGYGQIRGTFDADRWCAQDDGGLLLLKDKRGVASFAPGAWTWCEMVAPPADVAVGSQ